MLCYHFLGYNQWKIASHCVCGATYRVKTSWRFARNLGWFIVGKREVKSKLACSDVWTYWVRNASIELYSWKRLIYWLTLQRNWDSQWLGMYEVCPSVSCWSGQTSAEISSPGSYTYCTARYRPYQNRSVTCKKRRWRKPSSYSR